MPIPEKGFEVCMYPTYRFKLNGVDVEPWVNETLNTIIAPEQCKLYDDCINGLEKIFSTFNSEKCSKCTSEPWVKYREEAKRPDCGCCVKCSRERGYMRDGYWKINGKPVDIRTLVSKVEFDHPSHYTDLKYDGWGYFDPESHQCRLPRHLRSTTCLRFFCQPTEEYWAQAKSNRRIESSMYTRVGRMINVIQEIRECGEPSIHAAREAQKTLRTLRIVPWKGE
jgi:hypothetical protein